ncbi:MAG: metallophosphoesterase family protein [Anaerovibrio sp.]|uniref:purple acid phosphatase family protein n=1 Tax=Anaerovibrio sp. TaxID=1872532 RepID=UPI0025DB287D|nr:metallophosphoesterase family protein [Anaerovibrio sp.]MCR5177098.1 metallophosphoesterase family protein [Anaerovibrio sp.]
MNFNISRRDFLKISALSLISSLFRKSPVTSAATNNDILCPRQLITDNCAASRVIMWHSKESHPQFQVQLKNADGTEKVFKGAYQRFTDDDTTIYIYRVKLDSLTPGTSYSYQIQMDSCTSPWYPLTTNDNDTIKALIFPDSQCSDGYITWKQVATSAFNDHPDTPLFINMGDLVDNGEASYQWRQWFDGIKAFMPMRVFAPLMGNHETYDLDWKCRLPKAFLNYFSFPDNGSTDFRNYYYSFDYGPVHFIALNSQFEEIDPIKPGLLQEQFAWLENDVRTAKKPWNVVLIHKDIINYENLNSPEPLADIDIVGKTFMPYFDKLGIDLVLTAHQHTYRRHGHIYNFSPSEDKGPVYIDTGVAGNCRYNVPRTKRFDKIMLPQPETDNYILLAGNASRLTVQCFLPEGKLMDTCTLTNSKQDISIQK